MLRNENSQKKKKSCVELLICLQFKCNATYCSDGCMDQVKYSLYPVFIDLNYYIPFGTIYLCSNGLGNMYAFQE